ncbi:hypothetical protein GCM10011410_24690 [Hoyosella rhizosphaerae]|uniref:Uncharacterized protein n=2 Tax=Hoyosella rhizosphaerae TaxID=1755582 RepID=A0A916UFZ3_9ACTN|nr:hypothetical protein GCM10011410_24690 [Hoyosella rhizosphaerae]
MCAALVATGCSQTSADQSADEDPNDRIAVTLPVPAANVVVLNPGAEPRTQLEYNLEFSSTSEHTVTARSTISQVLGDDPEQDFSRPEVTMPISARVGGGNAAGNNVTLTVGDATSPDNLVNESFGDAAGSEATIRMDRNGSVQELTLSPTEESDDIARESLEHAIFQTVYGVVALPSEPVGVGAQWLVEQPIVSATEILQSTTVTLRERNGDVIVLDISVEQKPTLDFFDIPGAGRVLIDSFDSRGSGSITVDLTKPLPTDGNVDVRGEQQYSDPDSGFRVRQRTGMSLAWTTD